MTTFFLQVLSVFSQRHIQNQGHWMNAIISNNLRHIFPVFSFGRKGVA